MIELSHGCNHITCASCQHEFCFNCLAHWGGRQCSTGNCEVWDEDRLLAAGEARVDAEDEMQQRPIPVAARQQRVRQAMQALRENEGCLHNWVRRNGRLGDCERCGYFLPCYGMVCTSDCESTVCFTCASYRIPRRGWRQDKGASVLRVVLIELCQTLKYMLSKTITITHNMYHHKHKFICFAVT